VPSRTMGALSFVEDHAWRKRTGRNHDLLHCDETGMKPFSGPHEAMLKPPAITKGPLEAMGKGA